MDSQTNQIQNHVLKRFNIVKKVGSGAYGHVWKVEDRINKKVYALKKIFDAFQHSTDAQRTYRQIQILKQTDHPNIIKLHQTIRAQNGKDVYLVFEFMQADLHNVIAQGILKDVHIRYIVYQLAKALKYLHSGRILHRDLKPSNILINSNCSIKLCDFGLVRSLMPSENNSQKIGVLTEGVATRWYRAPQVLLGSKSYSTPADIWSFACIIYEILAQKPLFPGNSTVDQIDKILIFTGYPSDEDILSLESDVAKSMLKQSKISHSSQAKTILKDFPVQFIDLFQKMLVFNPNKRITIDQILAHEAVKQFRKPEQQVLCKKQIRTSIDDNKKLTVQEYRSLVYGSRIASNVPNKQISSSLQTKTGFIQYKKSISHTKISSSGSLSDLKQKPQKQKQPIKHVRSTKQFTKSLHSYTKSHEDHSVKYKPEQTSLKPQSTKLLYGANNKNNCIHQKYGDFKNTGTHSTSNTHGQTGVAMGMITSPKYISSKTPLFKSSKYMINKTQTGQK